MPNVFSKHRASSVLGALTVAVLSQAAFAQAENVDAPRNWQETLSVMKGHSAAAQAASTMRQQIEGNRESDIKDTSTAAYRAAETSLDNASNRHGVNASALDAGYSRDSDITLLQKQLDEATDDTDLAIINARAQVANGLMLNELIKLQSANGMFESQKDAQAEETDRAANAGHERLGSSTP